MYFTSLPDLFDVLRELWPILGPYALLQVMDTISSVFTFLCRSTHLNRRLKTGSWQPQSFVTTSVRSKTLGPTPSYISQTSHKCLMTPSSSLLHTGLLDISEALFTKYLDRFLDLHLPRSTGNTYLYKNSYYVRFCRSPVNHVCIRVSTTAR